MNPLAILIGAVVGAIALIKLAAPRVKEVQGETASSPEDADPIEPEVDPPSNVDRREAPDPEPES